MNDIKEISDILKNAVDKSEFTPKIIAEKLGKSLPTIYGAFKGKTTDIRVYLGIANIVGYNFSLTSDNKDTQEVAEEITGVETPGIIVDEIETDQESTPAVKKKLSQETNQSVGFCFKRTQE